MDEKEFLKSFVANPSHFMWFLGAGTSRTAGMPTASDIIWDLKLKHYCLQENQDIKKHDINNEVIKRRIQNYMDSKGYPELWTTEEYSFYFDLAFGEDRTAQQKYISEQLDDRKISLNIGHRCLAALIAMDVTKLIFTTNFDNVIERAYSEVSGRNLTAYHLEGSYAALDALNAGRFPIYAKIHGDVRYQSIKNISADLIDNDKKIKDCFHAAASRYGLVISGYSGRDENVMRMLHEAINQHNAFPAGIFWTVTNRTSVASSVVAFIEEARKLGINAHIVETGTFDIMLSKIWRLIPERPDNLDKKVKAATVAQVNISMGAPGKDYPVLRTNALPIVEIPGVCALVEPRVHIPYHEFKDLMKSNKPDATMVKSDVIYGFGDEQELRKGIGEANVKSISRSVFEDPFDKVIADLSVRSFYERALAMALVNGKPLKLLNERGFFLAVDPENASDPMYAPLKKALSDNYQGNFIHGNVPGTADVFWSEAVSVRLEEKNGSLFLMLRPEIAISPTEERRNHVDFIRSRRLKRYNRVTNAILDSWIKMLLGEFGGGATANVSCYSNSDYPAQFTIGARTVFSFKTGRS